MKKLKYSVVLFCNNKIIKTLSKSSKRTTIYEHWHEYKTQKPPEYVKEFGGKRNKTLNFELALVFPNNRWATSKLYKRDEMGRTVEVKMEDEKYRIKEIIPYWDEEKIYNHDTKKRIRYHELIEIFMGINEISQIFTLNNKLFVQVEDEIKMFGNKNLNDSERLFNILRNDLLSRKKMNFIFVKDISTSQRKNLYVMLEKKGYKRTELFRHYSY